MNPIKISNERQLFWDDYLINTSRTSATLKLHSPRREEVVFTFDAPWEGDGCDFFNIIKDGDIYRMYYLAWMMPYCEDGKVVPMSGIRVCVLESADGLSWTRPSLGLTEFNGSKDNNIIFGEEHAQFDNFFVFIDTNPACPPEERYKATSVAARPEEGDLLSKFMYYSSPDGIHWTRVREISNKAFFDTMNVALWDAEREEYRIYCRGFHDSPTNVPQDGVRDIRIITSKDFKEWSDPIMLDFGNAEDFPLYTNAVSRYPNASRMYIGAPTRYVERKAWSDNFEQLSGAEARKGRMNIAPRYGLATTDCIFMTSRDGYRWNRHDEAWMRPGIEHELNWVYGDCYPTPDVIFTQPKEEYLPEEMSFFCDENHWSHKPTDLRRFSLRRDGFLSYHAKRAESFLVTKPLLYEGGEMSINFSSSAIGYIYVTLRCGDREVHSCELFGDTYDRKVAFDGDISEFIGKEITLEFRMSDADIYSMIFE